VKHRDFLRLAGAGAAHAWLIDSQGSSSSAEEAQVKSHGPFRFDQPFDGAIVHERMGKPILGVVGGSGGRQLQIQLTGTTPSPSGQVEIIDVNHPQRRIPVRREGAKFFAESVLEDLKTEFVVRWSDRSDPPGSPPQSARTRVIWVKDSYRRYRFQVDDNSFFMRDIRQKDYKSLFDSPYLAMFRDFNRKYDAKVVLNLFYSTPEEDFNLSQLSGKYKSEWQDNSHWLKLAFHAYSEFPNHPFLVRTPEQLAGDIDLIEREIKRFAGEKVYTRTALLHWGTIRPQSLAVLIAKGWRTLSGSVWPLRDKPGSPNVQQYQAPEHALRHLDEHDAWYNFDNGLLFVKIDLCCNRVLLKDTLPALQQAYANPDTCEVMDLGTHEQYFWPFYKNYLPDHADRLDQAFRFVTGHGYKAIFPEEDPFERVRDLV
jgi:hypothetical protein